jgi:hypothetical protein
MDFTGIRWSLPSKGMVQTDLCNLFNVRVDGGGALLKSLRRSYLILMYIVSLTESLQIFPTFFHTILTDNTPVFK